MRVLTPAMRALVEAGGPFIGDRRPCTRVTVEPGYWLTAMTDAERAAAAAAGEPAAKLPYRWYQRAANDQVELEIPTVTQVDIDHSLESDADSCTITLANQMLDPVGQDLVEGIFGDPGAFTADRADAASAARWGIVPNDWAGILDTNALIRTYWGYGGHGKTIARAVADGDLFLKGVWLVDQVTPNPKAGTLTLACRDMFKLLIDQQLYPPLVPATQYPMKRCRWKRTRIPHPAVLEYSSVDPTHIGVDESWPATSFRPETPGWKWVVDIAAAPNGKGYWILGRDGGVFTYGGVAFYGSRGGTGMNAPAVGIAAHPKSNGYWIVTDTGSVYAFGAARYYGGMNVPLQAPVRRIVATASGRGYYMLAEDGGIFTFGDALFRGSMANFRVPGDAVVDMVMTESGRGYWQMSILGHVYAFGDATPFPDLPAPPDGDFYSAMAPMPDGSGFWATTFYGTVVAQGNATAKVPNSFQREWPLPGGLNDLVIGMEASRSGFGYLMVAGDGGVFSFGDAGFHGSLPGAGSYTRVETADYTDFTEIVRDLLLWSGFWLQGAGWGDVYGNLEDTGTYAEECLSADWFDKRNVIDAITEIRQIVGYYAWCDEEGAARFESANWWVFGNFMPDGTRTEDIHVANQDTNLIDWQPTKRDMGRSEVIVTSHEPTAGLDGTVTSRFVPANVASLKGMLRPGMFPQPLLTDRDEQALMAELIAMQLFFKQYAGTASIAPHPGIEINDQVWIYERSTGEARAHYVRGVSTSHNLKSGQFTMQLTTNRLGTVDDWRLEGFFGPEDLTGVELMKEAGGYWKASDYQGTGVLPDLSGHGNHLHLGPVLAVDPEVAAAATPLFLQPGGPFTANDFFVYLPGTDGNSLVRQSDNTTLTDQGGHLYGCTVVSSTEVRDEEGATWTVNRSATGAKSVIVDRPVFLFDGANWMEALSDDTLNAGTGSVTVAMAFRFHGTPAARMGLLGKVLDDTEVSKGYTLDLTTDREVGLTLPDGFTRGSVFSDPVTPGEVVVAIGQRRSSDLRVVIDGDVSRTVPRPTLATLSDSEPLRIGRLGISDTFATFEFLAAAVFTRSLTAAELADVTNTLRLI